MCVCVCARVYVCAYLCCVSMNKAQKTSGRSWFSPRTTWVPGIGFRSSSLEAITFTQCVSRIVFETVSLTGPGTHGFARLAVRQALEIALSPLSQSCGHRCTPPGVSGTWTQVLILAQRALYWMSQVPHINFSFRWASEHRQEKRTHKLFHRKINDRRRLTNRFMPTASIIQKTWTNSRTFTRLNHRETGSKQTNN